MLFRGFRNCSIRNEKRYIKEITEIIESMTNKDYRVE